MEITITKEGNYPTKSPAKGKPKVTKIQSSQGSGCRFDTPDSKLRLELMDNTGQALGFAVEKY